MTIPRSSVAGIVLAAGLARRFGGNKLSAAFLGKPLLCWAVEAALASRLHTVIVVLGHDSARPGSMLTGEAGNERLRLIVNKAYRDGQASSVIAGLRAVPGDASAAMFLMGDQPLLDATVIDSLIATHEKSGKSICYPSCNGTRRNPVIFGARLFPEILALTGDTGARALIEANAEDAVCAPFADELLFQDVDRGGDLQALVRIASQRGRYALSHRP